MRWSYEHNVVSMKLIPSKSVAMYFSGDGDCLLYKAHPAGANRPKPEVIVRAGDAVHRAITSCLV